MQKRITILWCMFWLPGVLGGLRLLMTLYLLFVNSAGLKLTVFLVPAVISYSMSLFSFYRLYRDGVPVFSLIIPDVLYALVCFLFKIPFVWQPFTILVAVDVLYICAKEIKSTNYPFEREGEDSGEYDKQLEDLTVEGE